MYQPTGADGRVGPGAASERWVGNSSGGTYRFTYANQVTIRPARLRVESAPLECMSIAPVGPGMRVIDGKAVFGGIPAERLDLESHVTSGAPTGSTSTLKVLYPGPTDPSSCRYRGVSSTLKTS